jgi:hypothetical protein
MTPTINNLYPDPEKDFERMFSESLASSCVYFNSNITCSKKPKTYLGIFSQPCAMYKGEKCDAFGGIESDIQWSIDFAKCMQDRYEKNKLKKNDMQNIRSQNK